MNKGVIPSFWGIVIPPKNSVFIDFPPETTLKVTSFAFGSIVSDEPSKITADVKTLLIADEDSVHGDECDAFKNDEVTLGTLIPNKVEQIQVDLQFSPLDIIEVHNSGSNEVHLSGYLEPIDSEYEEEEEEEEEVKEKIDEPVADPDTIQSRFANMAKNQPPKPVFQKKKNKKNKKEKSNENNDDKDDDNEDEENEKVDNENVDNEDDDNENEE